MSKKRTSAALNTTVRATGRFIGSTGAFRATLHEGKCTVYGKRKDGTVFTVVTFDTALANAVPETDKSISVTEPLVAFVAYQLRALMMTRSGTTIRFDDDINDMFWLKIENVGHPPPLPSKRSKVLDNTMEALVDAIGKMQITEMRPILTYLLTSKRKIAALAEAEPQAENDTPFGADDCTLDYAELIFALFASVYYLEEPKMNVMHLMRYQLARFHTGRSLNDLYLGETAICNRHDIGTLLSNEEAKIFRAFMGGRNVLPQSRVHIAPMIMTAVGHAMARFFPADPSWIARRAATEDRLQHIREDILSEEQLVADIEAIGDQELVHVRNRYVTNDPANPFDTNVTSVPCLIVAMHEMLAIMHDSPIKYDDRHAERIVRREAFRRAQTRSPPLPWVTVSPSEIPPITLAACGLAAALEYIKVEPHQFQSPASAETLCQGRPATSTPEQLSMDILLQFVSPDVRRAIEFTRHDHAVLANIDAGVSPAVATAISNRLAAMDAASSQN